MSFAIWWRILNVILGEVYMTAWIFEYAMGEVLETVEVEPGVFEVAPPTEEMKWNETDRTVEELYLRTQDEWAEERTRVWNEAIDEAAKTARGFKYPAHGPSLRKDIAKEIEGLKNGS